MNPSLVKAILADRTEGVQLLYGVATAKNTVKIAGSTVAVVLPALDPVFNGDYAVVLAAGADRLIIGPVNRPAKWIEERTIVVTTNAFGAGTITFNNAFVSAPIVTAINGDQAAATFYVQVQSRTASSWIYVTTPTIASGNVRIDYIAVGDRA